MDDQLLQTYALDAEDWSVTEDDSDQSFVSFIDYKSDIFSHFLTQPILPDIFPSNSDSILSVLFPADEESLPKKRKISAKQLLLDRAQAGLVKRKFNKCTPIAVPKADIDFRCKAEQGISPIHPDSKKCCKSKPSDLKALKNKTCEFCLNQFETLEAVKAHREKHLLPDETFACTSADCFKRYSTGEGLRLHVRNVHLMAKNWKCLADSCDRSFVRQSDLRMHIIRMHSSHRPCACPVASCGKSFACHSELRRHVNSCHKLTCTKQELNKNSNIVDPAFVKRLMLKVE